MTGAIFVKFSPLILMKIIKTVATRCQILRLECIKFYFGWGSATDPAGAADKLSADLWLDLVGLIIRGGEGKDRVEERKGSPYFFADLHP